MDSTMIIPVTFWNNSRPTFCISAICVSPNTEKLVTSSYTGEICLWSLKINKEEVILKNLLIGHKYSVTCLVCTNEFLISTCEGGLMCRWNLEDGYCEKINNSNFIHRKMQLYKSSNINEELLFTCGDYTEVFVIHPFTLQVIQILTSTIDLNWISSFHVVPSQSKEYDVVTGISYTGCVMLWLLNEYECNSKLESHSYVLPVTDVVALKYNQRSEVLIVTVKYWTVFDSEFSNSLCKMNAINGEKFLDGNFCHFDVVVCTNAGKFYIYSVKSGGYELNHTLLDNSYKISLIDPAINIFQVTENKTYFIMGSSRGKITVWALNPFKKCENFLSFAIEDKWVIRANGVFNSFIKCTSITCCIYILELDKLFLGCFDGNIVSVPAVQTITSFYYHSTVKKPSLEILLGHKGKVNCLLYPHEKYSYFQKSHLVSGGSDFSVCLWDINKLELLHKFCVQSGEILQLIVPPKNCSYQVKFSVCSVSSDHSAAVLNLIDKRCIILTSKHLFPVVSVNWKPLDDFIVIECSDGTVYVWQMETGHLDRVLNGIVGQEVLFACDEPEMCKTEMWNFYLNESTKKKTSMERQIFQVQEFFDMKDCPFMINGFLTNEKSECQVFMCNIESVIAKLSTNLIEKKEELDSSLDYKIYLLTQGLSLSLQKKPFAVLEKIRQETENFQEKFLHNKNINLQPPQKKQSKCPEKYSSFRLNDSVFKIIQFFLSSVHLWDVDPNLDNLLSTKLGLLKPEISPSVGIISKPGIYTLFFPTSQNTFLKSSSLLASACITITALSNIFQSTPFNLLNSIYEQNILSKANKDDYWAKLFSFYEHICLSQTQNMRLPKPKFEILAKMWQTKCLPLRKIVRKLLGNHLQSLQQKENVRLLESWYSYLPHFKIVDKISQDKNNLENNDLKTISLILFGIMGSDLKFKASEPDCQENYVCQICASFVYLLLLPNEEANCCCTLQTIAVDLIGRGYIVWEPYLNIEKVLPILLEMCSDFTKLNFDCNIITPCVDKCITAYNALKSIAIARTAAFINCLKNEIDHLKSQNNSSVTHFIENSKPAILSILIFLLEKTPHIMLLYLNDIILIIVYCINFSHLKQENLADLVPIIKKFRQLHHSVVGQKIAVGLGTGSIVLYDLKTGKSHSTVAHKDSVSAVKFSEDGKLLVSYSCYENRISFWQIFTGIFGLGHMQMKCIKSFQTYQIHDEEIKNHFEIAELIWKDNKSVMLSLCDGTRTIFHS